MAGWIDPDKKYPHAPALGKTSTSAEAAEKVAPSSAVLRERVLNMLLVAGADGLTTSEAALLMNEPLLNVRPRFSELYALARVRQSGRRRRNANGNGEIVWVLA